MHNSRQLQPRIASMLAAITLSLLLLAVPHSQADAQRADTTVVVLARPEYQGVATLVPVITFGGGRYAPEYTFTSPRIYLGRSAVYVADTALMNRSAAVREYDRRGIYRRDIGRSGEGPGEYQYAIGAVQELSDGRILLTDQKGILVFSGEGRFLTRWNAPSNVLLSGSPLLVDPNRGFLYSYIRPERRVQSSVCGYDSPETLQRFLPDGTMDGTAPPPPPMGTHMMCKWVPFVPVFLSRWSPLGYFVTSDNSTYAIDIPLRAVRGDAAPTAAPWNPSEPVLSLRRGTTPVPVLRAERQDYRDAFERSIRQMRTTPATWRWDGPEIPAFKPPIRSVFVTSDGRIWARLSQPARLNAAVSRTGSPLATVSVPRRWPEEALFDVLEPSGRYVGQVRFPPEVGMFEAAGDTVWAVALDSDDVPTIVRYRINWGPRNE